MSPVHLRNQLEDRKGLFRTRRPGSGHQCGWKGTEGNHTHTAIHLQIKQQPQNRGLEGYGQVLQIHQIVKGFFKWSMDNKRFNLASNLEVLGVGFQRIYLKVIPFKVLMVIIKGWNHKRHFKTLEERAARKRENQATIQAIEEQLNQTENTLIL
ncbi:hypothetical protein O181_049375 [Austropuccinia psidii MF-1]|uniref:Uncharacterized protein n=1 Tax=Austropuccinia psidii MF-1 TaxID=1389203 RepID=A0A9Q3DZ15_9BASI|nr:hypothetical protein [Austropuccinia psidii MF-1]